MALITAVEEFASRAASKTLRAIGSNALELVEKYAPEFGDAFVRNPAVKEALQTTVFKGLVERDGKHIQEFIEGYEKWNGNFENLLEMASNIPKDGTLSKVDDILELLQAATSPTREAFSMFSRFKAADIDALASKINFNPTEALKITRGKAQRLLKELTPEITSDTARVVDAVNQGGNAQGVIETLAPGASSNAADAINVEIPGGNLQEFIKLLEDRRAAKQLQGKHTTFGSMTAQRRKVILREVQRLSKEHPSQSALYAQQFGDFY